MEKELYVIFVSLFQSICTLTPWNSDSFGEDIAETESDSSEYNTNDDYDNDEESEDGFFVGDDDDYDMYPSSNAPKSRGN